MEEQLQLIRLVKDIKRNKTITLETWFWFSAFRDPCLRTQLSTTNSFFSKLLRHIHRTQGPRAESGLPYHFLQALRSECLKINWNSHFAYSQKIVLSLKVTILHYKFVYIQSNHPVIQQLWFTAKKKTLFLKVVLLPKKFALQNFRFFFPSISFLFFVLFSHQKWVQLNKPGNCLDPHHPTSVSTNCHKLEESSQGHSPSFKWDPRSKKKI